MDMFYLKDLLVDEINELHERHHRRVEEQERQRKRKQAIEMQHDPQCGFRRAQLLDAAASFSAAAVTIQPSASSVSPSHPASLVDFLASLSASPSMDARTDPVLPETPPLVAPQAEAVARGKQCTKARRSHKDEFSATGSSSQVESSMALSAAPPATAAPLPAIPATAFPACSPARSALDTPFSCATFAQLHAEYSSSLSPVLACFEEDAEEKEDDCGSDKCNEAEEKSNDTRASSAHQPLSPFAVICSPAREQSQQRAPQVSLLTFVSSAAIASGDMDSKHNTPPAVTLKQLAQLDDETTDAPPEPVLSPCSRKQLAMWNLDDAVDLAISTVAAAAAPATIALNSAAKTTSTELMTFDATVSAVWTADLTVVSEAPKSQCTLRSSLIFCCLLLLLSVALIVVGTLMDQFAQTLTFGGLLDVTLPSLLIDTLGMDQWPGVQYALFVPRASSFCS